MRRFGETWLPAGTTEAILSQDSVTGESSSVLTVAAGDGGATGSFASFVELFVIDGTLTIGAGTERERTLGHYGYTAIPGGQVDGPFASAAGCRVAMFTGGPRDFTAGRQEPLGPEVPFVAGFDGYREPWSQTAAVLPGVLPPGLMVKPLMQNLQTGQVTFLSGSLMRWMNRPFWEGHPHFEEQLYLEGEFDQLEVLEDGIVAVHFDGPGYSFRPARIDHLGPGCGTASYCLRVVRVPSRLTNDYSPEPNPYPSAYRPSVLVRG